uniref:Condensin complex subunit 1 C-terminal domain-containing protein n=1 Tax=Parascaris univalens TaxID=6257 RepID=A0A915C838_PARUN
CCLMRFRLSSKLLIYVISDVDQAELDEFLETLTGMHNEKMEQEAVAERGLLHKKKIRKSPLKMKSPKK